MALDLSRISPLQMAQAAEAVADANGVGDEYRETAAEGHTTRESAQQSFDTKVAKKQAEQKKADNKKKIIIGLAAAIAVVIVLILVLKLKK